MIEPFTVSRKKRICNLVFRDATWIVCFCLCQSCCFGAAPHCSLKERTITTDNSNHLGNSAVVLSHHGIPIVITVGLASIWTFAQSDGGLASHPALQRAFLLLTSKFSEFFVFNCFWVFWFFCFFLAFFEWIIWKHLIKGNYITSEALPRSSSIHSASATSRAGADEVIMLANTPSTHPKSVVSFGADFFGTRFGGWEKGRGGGGAGGGVAGGRGTFRAQPRFLGTGPESASTPLASQA